MPSPEFVARQNASLHVAYELGQMVGAALRLDRAADDVTRNALLESTLLHARSLIDFLLNGGRKTDIRGSTFLPGWQIESEHRQGLGDRKRALDQHLAHLTTARVTDGKQRWPYPELVNEMVGHMRRFHASLPVDSPARFPLGIELQRVDAALAGEEPVPAGAASLPPTAHTQPVVNTPPARNALTLSDFVD